MPSDYLKDLIAKAKKSKNEGVVPKPGLTNKDESPEGLAKTGKPKKKEVVEEAQSLPQNELKEQEKVFEQPVEQSTATTFMNEKPFIQQQGFEEQESPSSIEEKKQMQPFFSSAQVEQEEQLFPGLKKELQKQQVKKELEQAVELQEKPGEFQLKQKEALVPPPEEIDEFEEEEKIEIDSYNDVKIYRIPTRPLLHYTVPVPRPTASEKAIINTIKEAATRLIQISPFKIRDPEQRRHVYRQRILDILKSSPEINIPKGKFNFYTDAVVREMVGYGLIDPLVKDDNLEEIMVIGEKKTVYVFHREYEMMTTNIKFISNNEINDLINRIAREVGRRVDFSNPLLDARLPDGSRVNATIAPASISGSTLTIRKFKKDPFSIIDLINVNTLSLEAAAFLWLAYEGMQVKPANILIAGGTGSGKTTLLNVLASFIPDMERVITIEDTAELNLPLKHWIRLESRPPGLEGKGEITLDILTKNALRMRPDRIIVGEIRHDEAFSLFTAMNTGHDGSAGTVHANSAQETLVRVTTPPMEVPEMMLSGLDMIVVEERIHDRKKGTIRRVTEISEVTGVLEGKAQTQALFERDAAKDDLVKTGVPSNYLQKLKRLSGMSQAEIDEEIRARQRLLKRLIKEDIHNIEETSTAMKAFLMEGKKR